MAHAVIALVPASADAVVAFGAGHTHPTRTAPWTAIVAALATVRHVVLLRPSPVTERSVRILRHRCITTEGTDWIVNGTDWLQRWCTDGCDEQLATTTIWTEFEQPDQTAQRIVDHVTRQGYKPRSAFDRRA